MSTEGSPYWPDPRAGITNPSGNFPFPLQPNQPARHYSTYGESINWLNGGAVWRATWNTPLLDLRSEWQPNDSFAVTSVASPAVGSYGNGRSLSIQLTGRLATIPWLQAFYYYDGAVSNSIQPAIGRLTQRVPCIDQIILGGTAGAISGAPEGMSIVTLTPPASVRFWKVYLVLELPIATAPPLPTVRVSAGFN